MQTLDWFQHSLPSVWVMLQRFYIPARSTFSYISTGGTHVWQRWTKGGRRDAVVRPRDLSLRNMLISALGNRKMWEKNYPVIFLYNWHFSDTVLHLFIRWCLFIAQLWFSWKWSYDLLRPRTAIFVKDGKCRQRSLGLIIFLPFVFILASCQLKRVTGSILTCYTIKNLKLLTRSLNPNI